MKSGYRNRSPSPTIENSPKGSWRQAIFHRVQTPVNNKNHGNVALVLNLNIIYIYI